MNEAKDGRRIGNVKEKEGEETQKEALKEMNT
jgi:hypothetical protein